MWQYSRCIFAGAALAALRMMAAQEPAASATSAALRKYCATCHNPKIKTGGLAIDPAGAGSPSANAAVWEKVIRKLRTGEMPPPGAPRPEATTYDAMASYLENELDRAAAAKPTPGRLPLLHRLSRTEYQNAVRDLLALDAVPQEMDFST